MLKKIIILSFILIVAFLLIYWDQQRHYYCFSDWNCFTVWKRYGDKCYVIPGKYSSLFAPKSNYIILSNNAQVSVCHKENDHKKIAVAAYSSLDIIKNGSGVMIFFDLNNDAMLEMYRSLYSHKKNNFWAFKENIEYYSIDVLRMTVITNIKNN